MADQGGGGAQAPELKATLEKMEAQYAELAAARGMGRWIRLIVVLVILAVVLGQAYKGYATIRKQTVDEFDQATLYAVLGPEVKVLTNVAQRELNGMLKDLKPIYVEELNKQADERLPGLEEKFMEEARTLSMNVAEEGEGMLKKRLDGLAEKHQATLAKEFGLEDPKKTEVVLTNFQNALRGAFVDVTWDRLGKAMEKLVSVQKKAIRFLPKERRDGFERRMEAAWDEVGKQLHAAAEDMRGDLPEAGAPAKTETTE